MGLQSVKLGLITARQEAKSVLVAPGRINFERAAIADDSPGVFRLDVDGKAYQLEVDEGSFSVRQLVPHFSKDWDGKRFDQVAKWTANGRSRSLSEVERSVLLTNVQGLIAELPSTPPRYAPGMSHYQVRDEYRDYCRRNVLGELASALTATVGGETIAAVSQRHQSGVED